MQQTLKRVVFFSVKQGPFSEPIQTLHAAFGSSLPRYLPLEGGQGVNYLFCVAKPFEEIQTICTKHAYTINGECTEAWVEEHTYTNDYSASPSYTGGKDYCLMK